MTFHNDFSPPFRRTSPIAAETQYCHQRIEEAGESVFSPRDTDKIREYLIYKEALRYKGVSLGGLILKLRQFALVIGNEGAICLHFSGACLHHNLIYIILLGKQENVQLRSQHMHRLCF